MSQYSVVVVGMGKRGKHHAAAFANNPKFEVTGICDLDESRLEEGKTLLGEGVRTATDAAGLLGDRAQSHAHAERRYLIQTREAGKGLQIVAARGQAELDHPGSRGERGPDRIEGDMAVRGTRRHQEEIDSAGAPEEFVIGGGVVGLGKPQVLLRDLSAPRQAMVDAVENLPTAVSAAAVVPIGRTEPGTVRSRDEVLVHHRSGEMGEVGTLRSREIREGRVGAVEASPRRTAQQVGPPLPARLLGLLEDFAGQLPSQEVGVAEDQHRDPVLARSNSERATGHAEAKRRVR